MPQDQLTPTETKRTVTRTKPCFYHAASVTAVDNFQTECFPVLKVRLVLGGSVVAALGRHRCKMSDRLRWLVLSFHAINCSSSGQCTHRPETKRLPVFSETLPAVPANLFKHNGQREYQFSNTFGVETT